MVLITTNIITLKSQRGFPVFVTVHDALRFKPAIGNWRPDMSSEQTIKFLFNNQPDALIIQIYFLIKLFSDHHQEFSTVHSALVSFMKVWWPLPSRVRMEHSDSVWKRSSNLHETYQCRMYSRKLLTMGREDAPKCVEFYSRINLNNWRI